MEEAAGAASEWSAVRLFALARLGVEVRSAAELHARLLARVRTCASAVGGLEVWGPRIAGERALAPAMHESVQLFSQWYAAVGQECDQKLSGVEEEGEEEKKKLSGVEEEGEEEEKRGEKKEREPEVAKALAQHMARSSVGLEIQDFINRVIYGGCAWCLRCAEEALDVWVMSQWCAPIVPSR